MSITADTAKALLSSDDYGDRISGLNQLRTLDTATAYELLQPVVTDKNTRVRYAAISMLASIGHVDDDRTLALLRAGLVDPETDVQAAAADAIAGLKFTAAFDDLKNLYESSRDWIVRFSIVAALGELGDVRAFELLAEALQSGDVLLVPAAIGALGELQDPRAVPLLLPFVADEDWQVRLRTAQALGYFPTPEAQAGLAILAQDKETQIAQQAQIAQQGQTA